MIILTASKSCLTASRRELLVEGAVNVNIVQFVFSSDWDGLTKTAVFQAGSDKYSVLLDESNEAPIPWEVLQNPRRTLYAGVYGTNGESLVLPTIWASLGTIQEGANPGQDTQPPTPDVYSQILQVAKDAEDVAQSVRDDADSGKFNGEQGPTGPQGYTYTPAVSEEGVISWTNDGSLPNPSPVNITGPQGKTGETPDITAGTVETLEPGQDATAEITGETPNLVLNLGIPKGQPGQDAPQIDDSRVSSATPWSSRQIVDTLAPEFEASGAVVTYTPVAGYPLHVVSQITPVQAGEGDPSPDNVRPIRGWDEVNLWVGGANLFDISQITGTSYVINNGDGSLTINTTSTGGSVSCGKTLRELCPGIIPGTYILNADTTGTVRYIYLYQSGKPWVFTQAFSVTEADLDSVVFFYASGTSTSAVISKIQINAGESLLPYTPYNPASRTITLPFGQTVYGGTLDWTTGVLIIHSKYLELNSAYDYFVYDSPSYPKGVSCNVLDARYNLAEAICSHGECMQNFVSDKPSYFWIGVNNPDVYWVGIMDELGFNSLEEFKSWLDTQDVQIVYKTQNPITIQLTQQEILALSGTNTIYTDTGDTTVSGRADPNTILQQLAQRIAALEGQAING